MKYTVTFPPTPKPPEYPKLMRTFSGRIILLTSYEVGTCVGHIDSNTAFNLGEYSNGWSEKSMTVFSGTVGLSND